MICLQLGDAVHFVNRCIASQYLADGFDLMGI